MFSRLAISAARVAPTARAEIQAKSVVLISVRSSTSIRQHIENWDKANDVYYGPDRDFKNFPAPRMERCPPVRMGIIPESWFKIFYDKTGVTGPYVFGTGLAVTLMSKELWVVEHGFTHFIAMVLAIYALMYKVNPQVRAMFDKRQEGLIGRWTGPMNALKTSTQAQIDEMEKEIWREAGQKYLYEAKRENVELQLEEEYRKRQMQVYQDVKKRLDYQLESENTKRRFEQTHMVNWIVNGVVKGITPQQERDSIAKCIADLKVLAQKQA